MSAHDKAAARHARRFTLGVCKSDAHCLQSWDIPNLTESEVEAEKAHLRECYSRSSCDLSFEVSTT